jgi:hypothetical protein
MQQNSNYKSKSDPCWATSGVAGSNRVNIDVPLSMAWRIGFMVGSMI